MGDMIRSVLASSGGGESTFTVVVNCNSEFAGETISCTDGTTTYTQTCPSASPYTVQYTGLTAGTWTVSCTIGQEVYDTEVVLSTTKTMYLEAVPNGSTTVPVNVIQTWIHCADIWDKSYTTLNEVLSDITLVANLMASSNAVDYMIRSTDFTSILNNAAAATAINGNSYCLNAVLSDNAWLTALCSSSNLSTILDKSVPAMTSNTTPSGEASASTVWKSGYEAYKAFDNDTATAWTANTHLNSWVAYQFTSAFCLKAVLLKSDYMSNTSLYGLGDFKVQASSDGTTWDDLTQTITNSHGVDPFYVVLPTNNATYNRYRIFVELSGTRNNQKFCGLATVQFYGAAL